MKHLQISIKYAFLIIAFSLPKLAICQYRISGYLKTEKSDKTVYLAILRFDERNVQSENQIISSTKTDSSGYFEFKGKLLSKQDKFYRIYANESETTLDFIRTDNAKNYHNFIFSNNDTIYFPKNKSDIWFANSINTNYADKEWRKVIEFENKLKYEFNDTKNSETLKQINSSFLKRYKAFCNDSVSSPLIKLLIYSNIKHEIGKLDKDFQENPKFYKNILSDLKKVYGESSYYSQFREEITQLSYTQIGKKLKLYKYLNFFLIIIIILLIILLLRALKSKNKLLNKQTEKAISLLTQQEQKILQLIANGKSNKEIASELFISLSTVKTHITNIYSKLKVTSRQQIIEKMKNHTQD